jgi:hypothetical protein
MQTLAFEQSLETRLRSRIESLSDERDRLRVERDFWMNLFLASYPLPVAVMLPKSSLAS